MAMGLLNFLPEDPAKKEAARQGLLSLGAAMLQGRGNFGQVLGQGLAAGAQGYQGGLDNHRQAMLGKEQAERWRMENEQTRDAISRPGRIAAAIAGPQEENGAPTTAPQGVQSPSMAAPAQNAAPAPVTSSAALYRTRGDRLAAQGFFKEAESMYKLAQDMSPKLKAQEARMVGDKRVMVNVYDDGRTEAVDGFSPDAEKLSFQNTGGATVALDPYTGKPVNTIANTQTPDSRARVASDAATQAAITERAKMSASSGIGGAGLLPEETVQMMAQQYLAGDTSVLQNLGRGAQGPQNIIAIRKEITRQAKEEGKGGRDLAAQNAEYFGTKAGQRSAGTRIANVEMAVYEAKNLMPMAVEASANVARSGFLPFGKGQVMFNEQTNDPAMRQFAAANNALVNVYSRAISPSGVPTVADKEHAREMIMTAMDHPSYVAVVDQMNRELTAAQAAPKQVRQAFNDAVTRRDSHDEKKPSAPTVKAYSDAEKERRYKEWKAKQGK